MTPMDFMALDDISYNDPVGDVAQAMKKPLVIRSHDREWEVLSYYHDADNNVMVLDIGSKEP